MYGNPHAAQVLVVEDVAEHRRFLAALLEGEGYTIEAVATGRDALARIRGEPPDVVILDLALPDINGGDLLERLQQQHVDIPVLVVTADISLRARTSVQQASAYLMKPYDITALLTAVSALACGQAEGGPAGWQETQMAILGEPARR
jgi:two-component system repressor protein LuxO